jgi:hypothetical protein
MLLSNYLREISANYIATEERNITFFNRIIKGMKFSAEAGHTALEFYLDSGVSEADLVDWAAMQGLRLDRGLSYRLDWSMPTKGP